MMYNIPDSGMPRFSRFSIDSIANEFNLSSEVVFQFQSEIFFTNTCGIITLSGFIPVCALGLSQVGRINLGQNVSSLRYFAICGLQEGFEPFAINMKRDITMWFSKSLPQFVPVPSDHNHIEVSIHCHF